MDSNDQPNLFLVLEIDPDQPWSPADFERQLLEKKHNWSRQSNFANAQGLKAKAYLNLVPKLRELAQDENRRKEQAEEARKARTEGQAARLRQFEERLKLLEVRGYLLENELNQLIGDFADILPEAQIRKKVRTPIRTAEAVKRPARPALEPSLAKDIQRRLDQLGKSTLYDFLEMAETAENRLLVLRARDLYDGVQRKAAKTPQDTMTAELSGHCLSLFGSDTERARYDETLRLQTYESIKTNADTMAAVSKRLELSQVNELLRQARVSGLDVDEAGAILEEHAASKRYVLLMPADTTAVKNLLRCGHCKQLNDPGETYCTRCSKPLKTPCPKCNRALKSEDRACGNCGFPIGNSGWIEQLMDEAGEAIHLKAYDRAMERLANALTAWPAPDKNDFTQKIRRLHTQADKARKEQDKLVQQFEELIKLHQFYTARTRLPEVRNVLAANDARLDLFDRTIERSLAQADAMYVKLSAAKDISDQARLHAYQTVLDLCADYLDGKLAENARALEGKIRKSEESKAKLLADLQADLQIARREHRCFAANELLVQLKQQRGGPELALIETEISAKIKEAQRLITQAKAVDNGDEHTVVRLCIEATQICRDASEAQRLLAQHPPNPPAALQAVVKGDVVRLSWSESPGSDIRYLVIRKPNICPQTPTDGEQLSNLADTRYDDNTLSVGIPTFYSIYADRLGVHSVQGATIAKPVMRIAPVRNVTKIIDDGHIRLQWEPPAHVHDVIVRRSDQAYPQDLTDGQGLSVVGHRQATDSQLVNGRTYVYGIFSIFRDYEGNQQIAGPICVEAIVDAPPSPITDLSLSTNASGEKQQLRLSWTPPVRGEVVILHTQKAVDLRMGQCVSRLELESCGRVLATRSSQLSLAIQASGNHSFYPIIIVQDTGYVGQRREYLYLQEVSDLRVEDLGDALRARWNWPPDCYEVELAYSHLDWPERGGDITTDIIPRHDYERTGFYDLASPRRIDYYLWVRTVAHWDGERLLSVGGSPGCRALVERPAHMVLEYFVERTRRLLSPLSLTLRINLRKGTGKLPALILVGKEGEPPTHKGDGVALLPVAAQLLEEQLSLAYNVTSHSRRNLYARLFLEDDRLHDFINIRHPEITQLRLY